MSVHGYPGVDDEDDKTVEPTTEVLINWEWVHELTNGYNEDIEKADIKIHLHGHKFRAENLNIQVNDNVLVVKAEEDGKKFEQKFKLPSNIAVEKIRFRFGINEDKTETLQIHILKDIKRIQVPILKEVKGGDETDEENKTWISHCYSCHSYREDMAKVEIKIQLQGHTFKAENLNVQVINDDVLFVKAKDGKEKLENLIKLPSNVLVNKIQSKFFIIDEKTQTLLINFPKDVKRSTPNKYITSSGTNDCVNFLPEKILHSALCFVYCNCELQMPGNRATCCYRNW